jgi:hypothetical protein
MTLVNGASTEGRCSPGCFYNLQLQKSPSRIFGQNSVNSLDISKAFFEMGIWKFESSQVSQPVRRSEKMSLILAERPANGVLLRTGGQSLDSELGQFQSKIADSLRQTFEKLPFLGDCGWRPGSICTARPAYWYFSLSRSVRAVQIASKTLTPMPLSPDRAGGCAEREKPP